MYLFIDPTQAGRITLSLFTPTEIITSQVFEGEYGLTENVLSYIDTLVTSNNISVKDLKGIVVALGPGGFTGLRIVCAVVNTLSYLNSIPTAGDVIANLDTNEKLFASLVNLKSGQVLVPVYDREPNITIGKSF